MKLKVMVLAASVFTMMGVLAGCGKDPETTTSNVLCPASTTKAQFAYISGQGNDLLQYKVNNDGTLSALSPASVTLSSPVSSMVLDCDRTHLYVTGSTEIYSYSIGNDGTLTAIGSAVSGTHTFSAVAMTGTSVYAVSENDNVIDRFTVMPNGSLSALVDSTSTGLDHPMHMAFLPEGRFGYAANTLSQTAAQFSVGTDGSLTALNPATASTQGCSQSPITTARAADGKSYVYILSCIDQVVEVLSVAADGQLTSIQTVPTGMQPYGMSVVNGYIYTADLGDATGGSVTMYKIQTDGRLAGLSTLTLTLALVNPINIAVDTIGKMAYIIDSSTGGSLLFASIDSQGVLSMTGTSPIANIGEKILLK
jgi:6-phosphogluconolactonase (cycloisomerase 2 family)